MWKPDYITGPELQAYVRTGTYDAAECALQATAASRAVDQHCNRQFGNTETAEARRYTARYDYGTLEWVVDIDDTMDPDVAVEVDGVALTDFTLEPINAAQEGRPWTRLRVNRTSLVVPCGTRHEIEAATVWGWSAFPSSVIAATKLQGSRFLSRRESPHGIAESPEGAVRLLSRVDPDVAVMLRGLVRPKAGG